MTDIQKGIDALAEFTASQIKPHNTTKSDARRSRSFECLTYIDTDNLDRFLRTSSWISHYAYCYHDSDVWTYADELENSSHVSGSSKVAHTHVLIYTYDAKTCSAINKLFDRFSLSVYGSDNAQNTRVNVCNSMPSMWRYLIHADDPQKFQYSHTCRKCDDFAYWSKLDSTDGLTSTTNTGLSMVNDLISGVSYRLMCERYGKEYIYHAKYLEDMAARIQWEETSQSRVFDENMFKLVLSAEYSEFDIQKFMTMLAYVKNCFAVDFNNGKAVDIYLKG